MPKGLQGFQKGNRFWERWVGKKHSPASKYRMSASKIGKLVGHRNGMWKGGRPKCIDCGVELASYVAKRCPKCKGPACRGHHHHNWKGGISVNVHSIMEPRYRQWRSDVFSRDNWTCQTCGARGVTLEAHHIKSWARFPELRYDINNGATLCKPCHELTPNYRGRKY
jgi:5-methylcytosine-specific restriction endonuclease McrA